MISNQQGQRHFALRFNCSHSDSLNSKLPSLECKNLVLGLVETAQVQDITHFTNLRKNLF
jgi:hypothetical protein